jgi:hypothetical protein
VLSETGRVAARKRQNWVKWRLKMGETMRLLRRSAFADLNCLMN